jgi:hypothetical protein
MSRVYKMTSDENNVVSGLIKVNHLFELSFTIN